MQNVIIAVDLAKDVFEVAVAKRAGRIQERRRMSRAQFERFWLLREPCTVAMEACGGAHHWSRQLVALGFEVTLLPPKYVRPYRQRNKTDRVDCEAVLEAYRSPFIKPVAVKDEDQQAILALHRARAQWKATRTMRINGMRGMLREFDPRYRRDHGHRAVRLDRQHPSLRERSSPGELARDHAQRELERKQASLGSHQQAGRSLPPHAPDPRRTLRADRGADPQDAGQAFDQAAGVGRGEIRLAQTFEPGGRGAGQQEGADRLGRVEARARFRWRLPAAANRELSRRAPQ